MAAPDVKFSIGNDRFLTVSKWRGETRISLREYTTYGGGFKLYPTKKGISLTLENWMDLKMAFDDVTDAVVNAQKNTESVDYRQHIGRNVFVAVSTQWPNVDIRRWWLPKDEEKVVASKTGISLKPDEWEKVKKIAEDLHNVVPDLSYAIPCSMREDHQNQEGMLRCSHCNPMSCADWQSVI